MAFNANPLNVYSLNVLNNPSSPTTFTARTTWGLPIPPPPKSSYSLFAKASEPVLTDQLRAVAGSAFKRSDVTDKLKTVWAGMPGDQKAEYEAEHAEAAGRYAEAFAENPANKEEKASWDAAWNAAHPKAAKPAKAKAAPWSLPDDWSCVEKARVPPSLEETPLPPSVPEEVRATFGAFQGWYEEKNKTTSWYYPVLSVDPSNEVGELRKAWDKKFAKNDKSLMLMYYGFTVAEKHRAYTIVSMDSKNLHGIAEGDRLNLPAQYSAQTGRNAVLIVRGARQMEEDGKREKGERGAHMRVEPKMIDDKAHVDR